MINTVAPLSTTLYYSDSIGVRGKTLLTSYWKNQEYQTLLHILPVKLPRKHNVTSRSKDLLLHLIGHPPTYWNPTPIPWSKDLHNIQRICGSMTSYLKLRLATDNICRNNRLYFTMGSWFFWNWYFKMYVSSVLSLYPPQFAENLHPLPCRSHRRSHGRI